MRVDTLEKVRTLMHQLSYREKMYLLSDLAADLFRESVTGSVVPDSFPVLHLNRWPGDLPLRRSDLYNEYGRPQFDHRDRVEMILVIAQGDGDGHLALHQNCDS